MIRRFLSPDLGKLKYKARNVKHQINLHHISDLHISLVFIMVKKTDNKNILAIYFISIHNKKSSFLSDVFEPNNPDDTNTLYMYYMKMTLSCYYNLIN